MLLDGGGGGGALRERNLLSYCTLCIENIHDHRWCSFFKSTLLGNHSEWESALVIPLELITHFTFLLGPGFG